MSLDLFWGTPEFSSNQSCRVLWSPLGQEKILLDIAQEIRGRVSGLARIHSLLGICLNPEHGLPVFTNSTVPSKSELAYTDRGLSQFGPNASSPTNFSKFNHSLSEIGILEISNVNPDSRDSSSRPLCLISETNPVGSIRIPNSKVSSRVLPYLNSACSRARTSPCSPFLNAFRVQTNSIPNFLANLLSPRSGQSVKSVRGDNGFSAVYKESGIPEDYVAVVLVIIVIFPW